MQNTVTIKLNNRKAIKLLEDLESLEIIEIIKNTLTPSKGKSLSNKLIGSISDKREKELLEELDQMRSEWNRDI